MFYKELTNGKYKLIVEEYASEDFWFHKLAYTIQEGKWDSKINYPMYAPMLCRPYNKEDSIGKLDLPTEAEMAEFLDNFISRMK